MVPPTTEPSIMREYIPDPEVPAGFFRVSTEIIDPVTN